MTTIQNLSEELIGLKLKFWEQQMTQDLEAMKDEERDTMCRHLKKWITTEKTERNTRMIQTKIRGAKFRRVQTVDHYNFNHSEKVKKIEPIYMKLYNSVSRDNLPSAVFTGNAGTGKTHLSRSIGYAACQQGISVLFITAAEMVNQLQHAQKTYNLEAELNKYRKPQVIIIDELGYVSLDNQASNLFFQVISSRHDRELGTIATTNIPFGKFNQIFANDAIAHAIVDRLINDAEVFYMDWESYRPYEREQKIKKKRAES